MKLFYLLIVQKQLIHYPNFNNIFTPAPLKVVPSADQDILKTLPESILLNEYVQPVLLHNLIISKEPIAKYSPEGAHETLVVT
jgi:hypothetical protein